MSFIPLEDDSNEIYSPDPSILKQTTEGDPMAQFELVELYFNASYSGENDLNAFKWMHRSAEEGNIHAQFRLGDLYALGKGTCQSYTDAYKWYTKAAMRGYKKALIRIHNLYQEDIRIHCRGKLNSEEKPGIYSFYSFYMYERFKIPDKYRLQKQKLILNHSINYYTDLFQKCKRSNQDDPDIQQTMAFLYQKGYGVKKYTSVAMRYYTLAAKQGSVDAQYNLGYLYQKHTDIKLNYREAFYWYSLSAKGGNIAAQNCLGYFYEKGLSTDIDYQKSLYWYTKAANAGHPEAQVTLGKWYRKGQYVSQDYTQASKWYKLAAKQGNRVAQNCLDLLYQNGKINDSIGEETIFTFSNESSRKKRLCSRLRLDIDKLKNLIRRNQLKKLAMNALKGDGNAMYEIGQMYYSGEYFMKDEDTSFKWILNAANAGNKDAQFKIVEMYENGDSIEQNYHKMSIWVKKLVKKKDDVAQYKLGILYKEGLGVRKDPLESSKWIILSSDQGNVNAMYELGYLKHRGAVYEQNLKEAIKWYHESAIRGNLNACYEFGMMCLQGTVIKKNVNKGIKVLIYAAKHGHSESQYELGKIYENGMITPQDLSKSNEYYSMITGPLEFHRAFEIGRPYKLAEKYLEQPSTFENNNKMLLLLKELSERHHPTPINIIQTITRYEFNKTHYLKLIGVFIDASKAGIANLEFDIGCMYDHGIYSQTMEELFATDFKSAMHWYSISASKGDSRADYKLGIMYERGKGVTKDLTTAIEYYKKAAINNNNDARYRLACSYLAGDNLPKDVARAYYLFTEASNFGHKESRNALGLPNYTRKIDPLLTDSKPEELAIPTKKYRINMLETVAESGLVAVQYQLGKMYQDKDNSKAVKWLSLASTGEISDACYRLGVLYEEGNEVPQDYSTAKDLYEKAARGDHEDAIYRLAQMYHFGKGTRISYMEAYYLYLRASEMGHELSFKTLNITGDLYKNSAGITTENEFDIFSEEYRQSLLMCEYVAEQGKIDLQFKLGVIYESRFREPDCSKAFRWYQMASVGYHTEAIHRLGLLYEKGLGVTQNYNRALELFKKAKDLENSDSIYRLAVAYQYGYGVAIDPNKSVEHYILAAELDNSLSMYTLGSLYETGTLVAKNILESLKWYTRAYLQGYDIARSKLFNMYNDRPFEDFFYKKLRRILQVISTKTSDFKLEGYYRSLNILGFYYYYHNNNFRKAWEYFEKAFFDEIYFSFFYCDSINSEEKNDIVNRLELDKQLLDRLPGHMLYNIGMVYYRGYEEWSNKAKLKKKEQQDTFIGNEDMNDTLDTSIKQDYSKVLFFLKKSAEKNYRKAQHQLGVMYHHGHGVDKNINEAIAWHTKAAQNDDVNSSMFLGILYHCDGDFQDFSKAIKYYKMDDALNHYTGLLYHYGTGIEQSYEKALKYYHNYNISLRFGYFRYFYLGLMYYDSRNRSQDYEKAFRLFQKMVEEEPGDEKFILVRPSIIANINGTANKYTYTLEPESVFYGEAYYYLGMMYKNGQGTPQDDQEAMRCFMEAVKLGNEQAKQYIK